MKALELCETLEKIIYNDKYPVRAFYIPVKVKEGNEVLFGQLSPEQIVSNLVQMGGIDENTIFCISFEDEDGHFGEDFYPLERIELAGEPMLY